MMSSLEMYLFVENFQVENYKKDDENWIAKVFWIIAN